MSAPYVIPFNHQPSNTGSVTSSYIVPAGKYSRVYIKSAILPLLNSTALYVAKTQPTSSFTASAAGITNWVPTDNVHSIFFQKDNGSSAIYIQLGTNISSYVTSVSNHFFVYGANANVTYTFPTPSSVGMTAYNNVGVAAVSTNVIFYCYSGPDFIWLKAGDALSWTAGTVIFEEYNAIS